MNERPIIAVDAMGGDFGPSVVVPGAIEAARLHDLHVLLVGDTPKLEAELAKIDLANVHFDIVQADDVVHMNEKPSDILCRPYHLFQFGLMGDAFARDLLSYAAPRVSLLSIGEEEGKGNCQVKEAYELLKMAQNINFIGNAEGRDIFTGDIDVVICDGFVGNVVVKMSEGLAASLIRMLKRVFTSGLLPALGGMLAKGAFKRFARTIDYAEYGGAPLLGLHGLAIVCHGRSSARAMSNAIKMSGTFVRKGTNDRLAETILANEELTRFSRAI